MKFNTLNPNKSYLFLFLLTLVVGGLACNAVTGTADEPVEVALTPVGESDETAEEAVESTADEPTPLPSLAEAIQQFDGLPRSHEENPVYADTGAPPPGGIHAPIWQNCGIYIEPVEAKNVVHSLEHGAVWLTYDPELSDKDVTLLQELVKDQAYTVMSPYPGLRSAVVLTAWGVQFDTDTVDDPRILEFLLMYQRGPQTPELGAPCQGGTGSPRTPESLGLS